MANLIVKTGKGFSKEQAAENAGVDVSLFKFDSTQAYKKAASEDGFTLAGFAQGQIDTKAKGLVGAGFSVTVKAGKEDTRERPYSEDVVITTKARKYKMQYALVTGSAQLVGGTVVDVKEDKSSARKAAKEYVTANKVDVNIFPIKMVSDGEAVAANVKYTPSLGATEGEYIFFVLEA